MVGKLLYIEHSRESSTERNQAKQLELLGRKLNFEVHLPTWSGNYVLVRHDGVRPTAPRLPQLTLTSDGDTLNLDPANPSTCQSRHAPTCATPSADAFGSLFGLHWR